MILFNRKKRIAQQVRRFTAMHILSGLLSNLNRSEDWQTNVEQAVEIADLLNKELWKTRHKVDEFLDGSEVKE